MKKLLGCLILIGAFALTMNGAFACEKCNCGCNNTIKCNCASQKCDCGCQKGEDCKCDCCKGCKCENCNCCKKTFWAKVFRKKCNCAKPAQTVTAE